MPVTARLLSSRWSRRWPESLLLLWPGWCGFGSATCPPPVAGGAPKKELSQAFEFQRRGADEANAVDNDDDDEAGPAAGIGGCGPETAAASAGQNAAAGVEKAAAGVVAAALPSRAPNSEKPAVHFHGGIGETGRGHAAGEGAGEKPLFSEECGRGGGGAGGETSSSRHAPRCRRPCTTTAHLRSLLFLSRIRHVVEFAQNTRDVSWAW